MQAMTTDNHPRAEYPEGEVPRMGYGKHWPVALLVALPLLIYWPLTVGGRVLYWGLPLYQFYPWHTLVVEAVRAGHLPLWTDLLGNGAPLLANHQSALFYPFNLIYFWAPVERAMGYSVVLHLILAGLFAYAWGRGIRLSRFGATVVGLSFMLSGFFVSRTQFITIINGAAWLPLLFTLAERLARRRALPDAIWLGVTLALQFLAGHAQVWFYSLWAVGVYALARAWSLRWEQSASPATHTCDGTSVGRSPSGKTSAPGRAATFIPAPKAEKRQPSAVGRQRSAFLLLSCAMVVALGLSAIQLLPTAELTLHSQRAGGLDLDEAMTYSFWPWRLFTLAAPDLFGNPATGDYWGYATYWEDAGYVGVLPLLLALSFVLSAAGRAVWSVCGSRPSADFGGRRSAVSGRFLIAFFLILSLLSLILAMGHNTPIYPLLFKHVPGFGAFRAPARFLLFYTLGVSTLAGIGADRFRLTYRTQYVTRLTAAGAGAMLTISLVVWQMRDQIGLTIKPTFAPAIARFALWLGLSAILWLMCPLRREGDSDPRVVRSPLPVGVWRGLVIGLIAADLWLFAAPLTPTMDPALYRITTDVDHFLLARADDDRLFATYDYDYNIKFTRRSYFDFSGWGPSGLTYWLAFRKRLVPNLNVFTHTASVNNDEPLVVGRWRELMGALRAADWPARLRLLQLMNTGYVLAENPPPGLSPVVDVPYLYRLSDPLPRAWVVSQARIITDPDDMLSELSAPTFDPTAEVLTDWGLATDQSPISQLSPATTSLREDWNRRTIDLIMSQPGYLVLAYTYYPGWRATVDGRPTEILRANYAFMALPLATGEHQVVLRYRPASLMLGAIISGLSVLAVIGLGIRHGLPQAQIGELTIPSE
jgi:hypothetical protein